MHETHAGEASPRSRPTGTSFFLRVVGGDRTQHREGPDLKGALLKCGYPVLNGEDRRESGQVQIVLFYIVARFADQFGIRIEVNLLARGADDVRPPTTNIFIRFANCARSILRGLKRRSEAGICEAAVEEGADETVGGEVDDPVRRVPAPAYILTCDRYFH